MKKIILFLVCVSFLLFSFVSCDKEKPQTTEPVSTETEDDFRPVYDFDLSEYIKMGDYMGVEAKYEDESSCTEEEIDDAVFQITLSHAQFSEKEGTAELYNKVKFDFSLYLGEEELEDYAQNGYELVIGAKTNGDIEMLLGAQILGARAGDERSISYTYPETTESGILAGQTVTAAAKVLNVYQHSIPECNEEFVQALDGYEFETVADFRESVKSDILEQREQDKLDAVWTAFCETVEVIRYPEKELDYYRQDYKNHYQKMAESIDMELSEFAETYLAMDGDTFEESIESYAQELVKNDMIFTQLSRLMEITLTQEEYENGVQRYFENEEENFASLEEFLSYYTEETVRQNLIWDKALRTMVDNAVRIEE